MSPTGNRIPWSRIKTASGGRSSRPSRPLCLEVKHADRVRNPIDAFVLGATGGEGS